MSDLEQIVRDSGFMDLFLNPDRLLHDEAVRKTIDPAGRINPDEANPLRTSITLDWSTIDGRPKRSPQSGTLVLIWAHANTAPTTTCTISFTLETKQQGATPVGTVTISPGQFIGEMEYNQPIPAGGYFNPTVTVAGGASGVSTGVVIKAG